MTQRSKNRLLSTEQCGKIMGISASYIRRLIVNGKLVAQKCGHDWIVEELDLKAFMKTKKNKIIDKVK